MQQRWHAKHKHLHSKASLNTHRNIRFMLVTLETSQLPIFWLKTIAALRLIQGRVESARWDLRVRVGMLEWEANVLLKIWCSKETHKPQRPHLKSISQYSLEHIEHVSDTGDIPTPNILVEVKCATAFSSMPSGDVRDEICVCVCEC